MQSIWRVEGSFDGFSSLLVVWGFGGLVGSVYVIVSAPNIDMMCASGKGSVWGLGF